MVGKIANIIKNGNIVIPRLLLKNYKKLKLTDKEFIILIYLIDNNEFDPERISKDLGIKPEDVLNLIENLTKKDVLTLESVTNNNTIEEYVSLDHLYNKLALIFTEEKDEEKPITLFDDFEKEFGRTLSPMEFEIIGAWLEHGFTEELIKLALKEAVYNGVSKLNYIERILYEWSKKGIKNKTDLDKHRINPKKKEKKEVFYYDWFDE